MKINGQNDGLSIRCRHCGAILKPDKAFEACGVTKVGTWQQCQCLEARRERENEMAKERQRIAAEQMADLERRIERAGVPPKFRSATTERTDIVRLALEGKGLYIQGPVGVGKTHLAMAIAIEAARCGTTVRVTSSQRIMAAIRGTFGGEGSENDVFNSLVRPRLLVIDDLGKDAPTEWVVSMLYRIIEERYLMVKPVVITSNYSKRDLVSRLTVDGDSTTAEAIASRLSEMTMRVKLDGDDRRIA